MEIAHCSTQGQKKRFHANQSTVLQRVTARESHRTEDLIPSGDTDSRMQMVDTTASSLQAETTSTATVPVNTEQRCASRVESAFQAYQRVRQIPSNTPAQPKTVASERNLCSSSGSHAGKLEKPSGKFRVSGPPKEKRQSSRSLNTADHSDDLQLVLLRHIEQRVDDLEQSTRQVKNQKPSIEGIISVWGIF